MKRIPIASSVEKDDVVRAAYFYNLEIHDFIVGDATRPTETIYNVPGEATFLHYVDDALLGFPYVAVSGENAAALARWIVGQIETVSLDALTEAFASPPSDPSALRRLLGHAFLLAPECFDAAFDEYFRVGFDHLDPGVRRQAIVGVGYVGWPELTAPLRTLAEQDPDADVRRDARAMLTALLG